VHDVQVELLGSDDIEPGGSGEALLFPFHPELWEARRPGTSITLHEGLTPVGDAVIVEWTE
jgi:hypothetical protein